MRLKFLLIAIGIMAGSFSLRAQDVPNYFVATQLATVITKIGLPVDSAARYLPDYTKVENTPATETVYKSNLVDVYISFTKDAGGNISLIKCFMKDTMMSTAQKAIGMMGMIASGTAAPPGFTAYATPKYAAFLNPTVPAGYLTMVMVQGGK